MNYIIVNNAPYIKRESHSRQFLQAMGMIFFSLVVLLYGCFAFDSYLRGEGFFFDWGKILWLSPNMAVYGMTHASRVATLLLAMLISGMAIALPLAANNYTPRLIKMFTQDPINRGMFGLLVFFGAITMMGSWVVEDMPRPFIAGLCFFVFLCSLSAIVPYLFYLFSFLNPDSVLDKLRYKTIHIIHKAAKTKGDKKLILQKHEVIENIESISNIALGALTRHDYEAFLEALDDLKFIIMEYADWKENFPDDWHRTELEFLVGMKRSAKEFIQKEKLTLEVHLSYLLIGMFESSAARTHDAVNALACKAYEIASYYNLKGDERAVNQFCSLFNSVLRLAINSGNIRMMYNTLTHYRSLAEDVVVHFPEISLQIAEYIRDYALVAVTRNPNMEFAVQLSAFELHRLVQLLCRKDYEEESKIAASFLLSLPLTGREGQSFLGVYKARVMTAATMTGIDEQLEKSLLTPLYQLSSEQLAEIYEDLIVSNPLLYWEVTPQLMNLEYIKGWQKEKVRKILEEIQASKKESSESLEEKQTSFPTA